MFQAFVIVLRDGFEAFLIISIIVAYLSRTHRAHLLLPVCWGIGAALTMSVALGYGLAQRGIDPLWEGILGLVAVVLVSTLVIQMWVQGRRLKRDTEAKLETLSTASSKGWAILGVFGFTTLMITREGMETALLLVQVHEAHFLIGAALGLACTVLLSLLWVRWSQFINLKLFFQVTSLFLLLFLGQLLIYALHELSEAGVWAQSEAFHTATEPFSPDGVYGKWFPIATVVICLVWLLVAWIKQRGRSPIAPSVSTSPPRTH